MGKKANPAIIGAFVVGAVVLAVIGVALFGSGRLFRTSYPYVLFFTGDVNGLKVGAPVKFKGVEIGSVKDILLNVSDVDVFGASVPAMVEGRMRIPVIIELDQDVLAAKGGRVKPDAKTVKRLIDRGLRAQLSMESFVTGLLYVKLDLFPDSALNLVSDPTVKYAEIPTLTTPLEEIQSEAAAFLARLKKANVQQIVDRIASAVAGIDDLVNSPKLDETLETLPEVAQKLDGAIARLDDTLQSVGALTDEFRIKIDPVTKSIEATAEDAGETLRAATRTLDHTNKVLQPDSPIMYQFGRSLADLSEAASAIRRLAEDLERNPSMLVRGKAVPEEKP